MTVVLLVVVVVVVVASDLVVAAADYGFMGAGRLLCTGIVLVCLVITLFLSGVKDEI